jgi:predicted transposase YdaD
MKTDKLIYSIFQESPETALALLGYDYNRRRFFLNLLVNVFLEKHEPLTYEELEAMIKMEEIFDFSNNRLVHDIARHTIAPAIAKELAQDMAKDMAKDIANEFVREKQLTEIPVLRRFGLTNEQIAEALNLSLEDVQRAP